jgi:hypothetical protein
MLSSRIVITVTLSSAWMLSAQSQPPAPPPVGVKRVPPAAQGQTPRKLEDSGSLPADVKPEIRHAWR